MTTRERQQQDRETEARQRAGDWQPPTDPELREKRRVYLQTCKPQMYQEYLADGDLEEELDYSAKQARETATDLIRAGVMPAAAWHRAIRSEILDSPTD